MWSGNETDPEHHPSACTRSKFCSRLDSPPEFGGELQDFSGSSQWLKVGSIMLRREVASGHNLTLVSYTWLHVECCWIVAGGVFWYLSNSHEINSHVLLFRNGQISYWLLNKTEMNFSIHQRTQILSWYTQGQLLVSVKRSLVGYITA